MDEKVSIPPKKMANDDSSDNFNSDDVDERRSYTPTSFAMIEPRGVNTSQTSFIGLKNKRISDKKHSIQSVNNSSMKMHIG